MTSLLCLSSRELLVVPLSFFFSTLRWGQRQQTIQATRQSFLLLAAGFLSGNKLASLSIKKKNVRIVVQDQILVCRNGLERREGREGNET